VAFVRGLLEQVYAGLATHGAVWARLDASRWLCALRLSPTLPLPRRAADHEVPVMVKDLEALAGADWDACVRRLLPHVDGVRCVRALAEAAAVELPLVRRALEQLQYLGFVVFVDVFQYANVYAATPRVLQLLQERADEPADEAAAAAAAAAATAAATEAATTRPPTLPPPVPATAALPSLARVAAAYVRRADAARPPARGTLVRFFGAFGAGRRVREVCAWLDVAAAGVDERKAVLFGVVHGLLRRRHIVPLARGGRDPVDSSDADGPLGPLAALHPLLDGAATLDALCMAAAGVGADEAERRLKDSQRYTLLLR
jgi:DNA-binding transcriptional regulator YhcF (GntR family)